MSEKQKIYAEIVKHAIYLCRNDLSVLGSRYWVIAPWTRRRQISATYEILQFIHGIAVNTEDPEFSDADVCFINVHSQGYFGKKDQWLAFSQGVFAPKVRSLIAAMPDEYKSKLNWSGPMD